MDVIDSVFELLTDVSSSDSECELSSPSVDSIDGTNVVGVYVDTFSGGPYGVYEQSQHSGDDHNDIPLCSGFGKEHWVGLDVILLNELGVPVADDICRNFDPHECIDANPFGVDDVGLCILNSLPLFEVPLMWRFSLHQCPL